MLVEDFPKRLRVKKKYERVAAKLTPMQIICETTTIRVQISCHLRKIIKKKAMNTLIEL